MPNTKTKAKANVDTKTKHYLNKNVYQASKERILDAINQSDTQAVLCSGGKDSTLVVNLLREVQEEQGIHEKINIIFMDEEVINDEVLTYIHETFYLHPEKYNLYYYALPMTCDMYNHGNTMEYVQNDPQRNKHIHEYPDYAITNQDLGIPEDKILTRYELADIQSRPFKGKVCLFKGIRTDESLFRLTQVIRRKHSPHIGGHTKKHFECVPIYDWTEKDVFLYYYKNNISYCGIYDKNLYSNAPLRISTPMHAYNTKTFNNLRKIDPDLMERIIEVFPEMSYADRYQTGQRKTQNKPFTEDYKHNLYGLMQYIEDCYPDKAQQKEVKKKILWAYKKRNKNKKRPGSDKFGGYPLYYLFQVIQRGSTMRNIIPNEKPSLNCYTFEGYTQQDYITDKNKRGEYYDKQQRRKDNQTTN